ncbi:MAG: RDD family protein [Rhodospirillales bacterium]|nr:RDD family protein [Rhodospirillales bacterium]
MIYRAFDSYELIRGTRLRRIVAFLLDGLILAIGIRLLAGVLFLFGIVTLGLGMPLFGLLPVVPLLYNWLSLLSGLSATPGQAMMGLIVRRNDDLGPPGALAALVWVIGFYVSLALSGLPLLLALFTEGKRTGHDLLSGLVVVRARALTGGPRFWNMRAGGSPFA